MPLMENYNKSIQYLKGVGEKRAQFFKKLGIDSVGALLDFFPRAYKNWSNPQKICDCKLGEPVCIKATVCSKTSCVRLRSSITLYTCSVTDGQSFFYVKIFNNPYSAKLLIEGKTLLFYGKLSFGKSGVEMLSPEIADLSCESIRPIYKSVAGLNSKAIEKTVKTALNDLCDDDFLPQYIINKYNLLPRSIAVRQIHFPDNMEILEKARRRLIFEELFLLSLGMMASKARIKNQNSAVILKDYTKEFCDSLPFELTDGQQKAIKDCISDMQSPVPMSRLIQGDVGSGKTAVAAALCYTVAKCGYQAAIMAPTEVLASQHFETISKMLGSSPINCALLTGSTKAKDKKAILSDLKDGNISIICGTHALLTETVEFCNLGLVITDEQHRFGVNQRNALMNKGKSPHVLVMSATPIPRTLGLIIYGDLDISIIDTLPKGRAPIKTYLIDKSVHDRAYGFVKKELDAGHNAYIVCPLIEESDSPLTSAKQYYEKMKNEIFSKYNVALLHGKMTAKEKNSVMQDFKSGNTRLLISTTVIEVGVDVPTATVMMIEDADRFGLSQLHQLRGRIGRSNLESFCILVSDSQNPETVSRLKTFAQTSNGFDIADKDLALRGPGDFLGERQHGLPQLKIADLSSDINVLRSAGITARELLKQNPDLSDYPELRAQVNQLFNMTLSL